MDNYNPRKDAHDSYYAAIEAKRERGDHRIEALERNLFALERFVHDLQREILDLKKALSNG